MRREDAEVDVSFEEQRFLHHVQLSGGAGSRHDHHVPEQHCVNLQTQHLLLTGEFLIASFTFGRRQPECTDRNREESEFWLKGFRTRRYCSN